MRCRLDDLEPSERVSACAVVTARPTCQGCRAKRHGAPGVELHCSGKARPTISPTWRNERHERQEHLEQDLTALVYSRMTAAT